MFCYLKITRSLDVSVLAVLLDTVNSRSCTDDLWLLCFHSSSAEWVWQRSHAPHSPDVYSLASHRESWPTDTSFSHRHAGVQKQVVGFWLVLLL